MKKTEKRRFSRHFVSGILILIVWFLVKLINKMNMMRRLKSIASGRSSVSDPVIIFSLSLCFLLCIFMSFCIYMFSIFDPKLVWVVENNEKKNIKSPSIDCS